MIKKLKQREDVDISKMKLELNAMYEVWTLGVKNAKLVLFYRTRNFSFFSPSTLALSPITGSLFFVNPQILLIFFHKLYTSNFSLFLGVHHFITCIHGDWKNCTTYRWTLNNFKTCQRNFRKPFLFSPPATVVFILFLLFEVKDNDTWQSETFGVPDRGLNRLRLSEFVQISKFFFFSFR